VRRRNFAYPSFCERGKPAHLRVSHAIRIRFVDLAAYVDGQETLTTPPPIRCETLPSNGNRHRHSVLGCGGNRVRCERNADPPQRRCDAWLAALKLLFVQSIPLKRGVADRGGGV